MNRENKGFECRRRRRESRSKPNREKEGNESSNKNNKNRGSDNRGSKKCSENVLKDRNCYSSKFTKLLRRITIAISR